MLGRAVFVAGIVLVSGCYASHRRAGSDAGHDVPAPVDDAGADVGTMPRSCSDDDPCAPGTDCAPSPACDGSRVCVPTGCSGTPVCGCDGVTYPDACAAHDAGVGVAADHGCVVGALHISASPQCHGADDSQLGWSFSMFREAPADCGGPTVLGTLDTWVGRDLDRISLRQTYELGTGSDVAHGLVCFPPGCGAHTLTGSITVEAPFRSGAEARLTYDLADEFGTRYVASGVPIERWCGPIPRCPRR